MIDGGTAKADFAAPATLPSLLYRSAASRNTGIALANVYTSPIQATVTVNYSNGTVLGTAEVPLAGQGHSSGNLYTLFPGLPDFLGSVEIGTTNPQQGILAWTLNEDGGMISTLPPGRLEWPISHFDRIWLVFNKALRAAREVFPADDFDSVNLLVTPKWIGGDVFNATSFSNGTVDIPESLSELMSDSESELGWIVAHELGHQVQFRRPSHYQFTPNNPEVDADKIGLLLSLYAGFDPYAAAGALAKLAMATGNAGLQAQQQADYDVSLGTDPHPSYGTRIDILWTSLNVLCLDPNWASNCRTIKQRLHPDFPWSTPMIAPRGSTR
jgi:hypothetical protein